MRLQRYCICGAVLNINVEADRKAAALAAWFARHTGEGHAPATRTQARREGR